MTALSGTKENNLMTFTIDTDNNITAHGTPEEAAATATPFDSFASQKDLGELVAGWPGGASGGHLEQPAGGHPGQEAQGSDDGRYPNLEEHSGIRRGTRTASVPLSRYHMLLVPRSGSLGLPSGAAMKESFAFVDIGRLQFVRSLDAIRSPIHP